MLNVNFKTISKLLTATALATAFVFTSVNVSAAPHDGAAKIHQVKKHKGGKKGSKQAQSKKTLKDCPSCWNG